MTDMNAKYFAQASVWTLLFEGSNPPLAKGPLGERPLCRWSSQKDGGGPLFF